MGQIQRTYFRDESSRNNYTTFVMIFDTVGGMKHPSFLEIMRTSSINSEVPSGVQTVYRGTQNIAEKYSGSTAQRLGNSD